MKKFFYITVAFMLTLMFNGCYYMMTEEQREEQLDLRGSIGDTQFVGSSGNLDARGMMQSGWW